MNKILFLDIDGVLNKGRYGEDTYYDVYTNDRVALDQNCVENLNKLLLKFSDLKIVWSTSWRYYNKEYWHNWLNPVMYLEKTSLIKERVIGKTPMKLSSEHFHDIKWWLNNNRSTVEKFVILEDSYFPNDWYGLEDHLVQTLYDKGFDDESLQKAEYILNNVEFNLEKFNKKYLR